MVKIDVSLPLFAIIHKQPLANKNYVTLAYITLKVSSNIIDIPKAILNITSIFMLQNWWRITAFIFHSQIAD